MHSNPEHKTIEYKTWLRINQLCRGAMGGSHNRRYYYDKGIKVFPAWEHRPYDKTDWNERAFISFLECVGRKPSKRMVLGRDNKNEGFVPGNVRWMDTTEQQRGKNLQKKFSYSYDEELIKELQNRGYDTVILERQRVKRGRS